MDACGVVDAAGEGSEAWLGERVVAITKMALGGIAEYALDDDVSVFRAPPQFDDAEAAAFFLPFQTSHLALFRRLQTLQSTCPTERCNSLACPRTHSVAIATIRQTLIGRIPTSRLSSATT
jgi:NADPH:quinone reductase-like Zn-dependent oxidoreductase